MPGLPDHIAYSKLPNDITDKLLAVCTPYEFVVIVFLIRQTIGFQRPNAKLSTAEWLAGTGLKPTTLKAALASLRARDIVLVRESDKPCTPHKYAINPKVYKAAKPAQTRSPHDQDELGRHTTKTEPKKPPVLDETRSPHDQVDAESLESDQTRSPHDQELGRHTTKSNPYKEQEKEKKGCAPPPRSYPPTEPPLEHQPAHLLWRIEMSNGSLFPKSAMGQYAKAAAEMLSADYTEDEIVTHYETQRDRRDSAYSLTYLAKDIGALRGRKHTNGHAQASGRAPMRDPNLQPGERAAQIIAELRDEPQTIFIRSTEVR